MSCCCKSAWAEERLSALNSIQVEWPTIDCSDTWSCWNGLTESTANIPVGLVTSLGRFVSIGDGFRMAGQLFSVWPSGWQRATFGWETPLFGPEEGLHTTTPDFGRMMAEVKDRYKY